MYPKLGSFDLTNLRAIVVRREQRIDSLPRALSTRGFSNCLFAYMLDVVQVFTTRFARNLAGHPESERTNREGAPGCQAKSGARATRPRVWAHADVSRRIG